jgi:hypothetical protein
MQRYVNASPFISNAFLTVQTSITALTSIDIDSNAKAGTNFHAIVAAFAGIYSVGTVYYCVVHRAYHF